VASIPSEVVEAAAKEVFRVAAQFAYETGSWDALSEGQREVWIEDARRILAAAAPHLMAEALRGVADDLDAGIVYGWDSDRQYAEYLRSRADEMKAQ